MFKFVRNSIFTAGKTIVENKFSSKSSSNNSQLLINKYRTLHAELAHSKEKIEDIGDFLLQEDDHISDELGASCKAVIDEYTNLEKEFQKVCEDLAELKNNSTVSLKR